MKTKIQIKSVFGKLLFEYESENNSLRKTVEKAISSRANLRHANLRNADLRSANLRNVNLSNADLKKIKHLYQLVPEEGSFIAWKKASGCLVKLEIPAKAKRHNSLGGRKCRASYVKTLQIWDSEGNEVKECFGSHDNKTLYKVGRLTRPNKYDPNPLEECSHGIHFFISKQEALDW
jgi:hypothetical protein